MNLTDAAGARQVYRVEGEAPALRKSEVVALGRAIFGNLL